MMMRDNKRGERGKTMMMREERGERMMMREERGKMTTMT